MTASAHETALGQDRIAADLDGEIIQRVLAAGLTLEETAAIAVDPLVRRRIATVLADLDQVVRVVRDAAFGTELRLKPCGLHPQPGSSDELVHYWLDQGESALDLATTALLRAAELEEKWGDDVGVLRTKLDILREAVSNH